MIKLLYNQWISRWITEVNGKTVVAKEVNILVPSSATVDGDILCEGNPIFYEEISRLVIVPLEISENG